MEISPEKSLTSVKFSLETKLLKQSHSELIFMQHCYLNILYCMHADILSTHQYTA